MKTNTETHPPFKILKPLPLPNHSECVCEGTEPTTTRQAILMLNELRDKMSGNSYWLKGEVKNVNQEPPHADNLSD